jgi:hypothetical protein
MGRTRDVSKILTSNTSILSLASASSTYQTKASNGLTLITPVTIANTSGTASIGTNGTVSFASASAISFNNVFNQTYDFYKIVVSTIYGSTATDIRMRLRASGSDNSSSIYNFQRLEYSNITLSGGRSTNQTSWAGGEFTNSSTVISSGELFLSNPFNAVHTTGQSSWVSLANGVDAQRIDRWDWVHKSNDSFTGFTIFGGAGTITGTISVYGYNK